MIDYILSTNWKWLLIIAAIFFSVECIYYFFKLIVFFIKLGDLKTQLSELNSQVSNLGADAAQLKRQVFDIEQDFKALKDSLPHDIKSIYDSNSKNKIPPPPSLCRFKT